MVALQVLKNMVLLLKLRLSFPQTFVGRVFHCVLMSVLLIPPNELESRDCSSLCYAAATSSSSSTIIHFVMVDRSQIIFDRLQIFLERRMNSIIIKKKLYHRLWFIFCFNIYLQLDASAVFLFATQIRICYWWIFCSYC